MEKIAQKFDSFHAADEADLANYQKLSGNERLAILLELIRRHNSNDATIERCVRIYPLAECGKS